MASSHFGLLTKLQRQAETAMRRRGHEPGRWITETRGLKHLSDNVCVRCGMGVQVNTRPAPNEIDIGGEAVALTCTGSMKNNPSQRYMTCPECEASFPVDIKFPSHYFLGKRCPGSGQAGQSREKEPLGNPRNRRLLETISGVRIYRDSETQEFVVRYPNGEEYFTNDRQDAINTAHDIVRRGENRNPPRRRELTIPEKHSLRIAQDTLRMPAAMRGVMGGPSLEEARDIIRRLTGQEPKENPPRRIARFGGYPDSNGVLTDFKGHSSGWRIIETVKEFRVPEPLRWMTNEASAVVLKRNHAYGIGLSYGEGMILRGEVVAGELTNIRQDAKHYAAYLLELDVEDQLQQEQEEEDSDE